MPGLAQRHRINQRDIERCLNNLNQSVLKQLNLQKSKTGMQPNWINKNRGQQLKHGVRSDMINNSKDYQELNNAVLALSKGNLALANRMLNSIIHRLVKTNSDPKLIQRLKELNRATAPNQNNAPGAPQIDPNSNAGLALSIELGMSAIAQQQAAEAMAAEEAYNIQVSQEVTFENEQQEETIEEIEREEEQEEKEETLEKIMEESDPQPKPGDVEYYDKSKAKDAAEMFGEEATKEMLPHGLLKHGPAPELQPENTLLSEEVQGPRSSPTPSPGG